MVKQTKCYIKKLSMIGIVISTIDTLNVTINGELFSNITRLNFGMVFS